MILAGAALLWHVLLQRCSSLGSEACIQSCHTETLAADTRYVPSCCRCSPVHWQPSIWDLQ